MHLKSTGLIKVENDQKTMSPGGMHTLAGFISNLLSIITGRTCTDTVLIFEHDHGRFLDETDNSTVDHSTGLTQDPWRIWKKGLKVADDHAQTI